MTTSNDIDALYEKIDRDNYDINSITSYELLLILDNQINNFFKITEYGEEKIDLTKLVPGEEEHKNDDSWINFKKENKLKYNFQDDAEQLNVIHMRKSKLINKFYLKQSPSLTTLQYLERIFKHCSLSLSVILTCSVYLFNLVLGIFYDHQVLQFKNLKLLPLDKLNFYRVILTLIRVSLKFIEDKNYKNKYYCKIVGLNIKEYLNLELNFMFLIDFKFFVNELILVDNLKFLKKFNDFVKNHVGV